MNAIAPLASRGLPALAPSGPRLSPDLGAAVRRAIEAPDAPPMPVTALVKGEARDTLERLDRVMAPMAPATLRAWLAPIVVAVRNPPDKGRLEASFAAIMAACADLPDCACTGVSQRAALASLQFWPSAADVRTLLSNAVADLFRTRAGLRAVARSREEDRGERASPDQARAGFSAALAALGDAPETGPRRSAKGTAPALSRETLAHMYRAAGLAVPGPMISPAPMAPNAGEAA